VNLIARLFGKSESTDVSVSLLCPRCECVMDTSHECGGMTRRLFFGTIAGAAVVLAAPAIILPPAPIIEMADLRFRTGGDVRRLLFSLSNEHRDWVFETQALAPGILVTLLRKQGQVTTVLLHNPWGKR
jgi:hypothetical protein